MDPDAAALVELVSRRDPAPCPVCEYNLKGIQQPRCPECGATLRLEIGSENLRLGPWLLAMLGPVLAMGFDGVVGTLMTVAFVVFPPHGRGNVQVALAVVGVFLALAASCGVGVMLLVRRRRVWQRRPVAAQWRAAVLILVCVFLVHALYAVTLRLFMH